MSAPPRVAVVIVSFETRDTLLAGLAALEAEAGRGHRDRGGGQREQRRVRGGGARALPRREADRQSDNVGFARACNQGAGASQAPLLLFLNPDATLAPAALALLAGILEWRPSVGAVGPRTRGANGDIQVSTGSDLSLLSESAATAPRAGRRTRARRGRSRGRGAPRPVEREADWVSGACLMVRREAFDAVSGFDERFFLYEEDADLCRRLRAAGWSVLYTPAAEARHASAAAWRVRPSEPGSSTSAATCSTTASTAARSSSPCFGGCSPPAPCSSSRTAS